MRLPVFGTVVALAWVGVVAANVGTGCSYTSVGQGGDAGALDNDSGPSSECDAGNLTCILNSSGSGGFPSSSSGGFPSSSSGGFPSSSSGSGSGGSSGGFPSSSSGSGSGGSSGSSSGSSSGGGTCVAGTLTQHCPEFWQFTFSSNPTCSSCMANSNCPKSAPSGCSSSFTACKTQCSPQSANEAAYCNCMINCAQTDVTQCCAPQIDNVMTCETGGAGGAASSCASSCP